VPVDGERIAVRYTASGGRHRIELARSAVKIRVEELGGRRDSRMEIETRS
jgi:hypothetical protein